MFYNYDNDKKIILEATISYTVDNEHPDWQYMNEKQQNGINKFSDDYYFDKNYYSMSDKDYMIEHAKYDLLLVAGGGYDYEHVHNAKFKFKFYD